MDFGDLFIGSLPAIPLADSLVALPETSLLAGN